MILHGSARSPCPVPRRIAPIPETNFPIPRFRSETFIRTGRWHIATAILGCPPSKGLRAMVRSLHIDDCRQRAHRRSRSGRRGQVVREHFNRGYENEKRSNRSAPCCKDESPKTSGACFIHVRSDLITLGAGSHPTVSVFSMCLSPARVSPARPGGRVRLADVAGRQVQAPNPEWSCREIRGSS